MRAVTSSGFLPSNPFVEVDLRLVRERNVPRRLCDTIGFLMIKCSSLYCSTTTRTKILNDKNQRNAVIDNVRTSNMTWAHHLTIKEREREKARQRNMIKITVRFELNFGILRNDTRGVQVHQFLMLVRIVFDLLVVNVIASPRFRFSSSQERECNRRDQKRCGIEHERHAPLSRCFLNDNQNRVRQHGLAFPSAGYEHLG